MFYIFLILGFFCNVSPESYNPHKDSLLLHLDKIRDNEVSDENAKISETSEIEKICEEKPHNFSVYYRMVYYRICANVSKESYDFDRFCDDLQSYNSSEGKQSSNNQREKVLNKIYGCGIKSEERWLALKSCVHIRGYYKEKERLKAENNSRHIYPSYSEWLIHSVPFGLPVACGYTEEQYRDSKTPPSIAECLPPSYKWGLYVMFLIDGLIIFAIIISNVTVLAVSFKTKVIYSTHGQLRSSLAVADLLTSVVVCGCINTTRTVYFSPHKFSDKDNPVTLLDYHSQSYIDGFGITTVMSLAASVLTLVAISIDRFIAVFRPLSYKVYVGKIKCCTSLVIVFVWTLSFVLALCPILLPSIPYQLTALGVIIAPAFYLAYVISLGGSLLCIWVLNLWMFVGLKKRRMFGEGGFKRKVANPDPQPQSDRKLSKSSFEMSSIAGKLNSISNSLRNKETNKKVEHKSTELVLTTTVRLIVVAFSVAIIPSILVMICGGLNSIEPTRKEFDPTAKAVWNSLAYLASRILFSNSFFNCLIYSYKSSKFRKAARALLLPHCCVLKKASFNVFSCNSSAFVNPSFNMNSGKATQETAIR